MDITNAVSERNSYYVQSWSLHEGFREKWSSSGWLLWLTDWQWTMWRLSLFLAQIEDDMDTYYEVIDFADNVYYASVIRETRDSRWFSVVVPALIRIYGFAESAASKPTVAANEKGPGTEWYSVSYKRELNINVIKLDDYIKSSNSCFFRAVIFKIFKMFPQAFNGLVFCEHFVVFQTQE